MAWSTIRKATEDDRSRLEKAARSFCVRHSLRCDSADYEDAVRKAIDSEEEDCRAYGGRRRLATAWRAIVRRVLESPNAEGIAYGYVGFSVE